MEDKFSFDLVHQRLGLFAATGDLLQTVVTGLIDLVKPGGWIQVIDADLTGPEAEPDSPLSPSVRLIKSMVAILADHSSAYAVNLKHIFRDSGLVGVQEQVVDVKLGYLNTDSHLAVISTTSFVQATMGMVAAAKGMPL